MCLSLLFVLWSLVLPARTTNEFVFVCMDMGGTVQASLILSTKSSHFNSVSIISKKTIPDGTLIDEPKTDITMNSCLNGSGNSSNAVYILKTSAAAESNSSATVMYTQGDKMGESHSLLKMSDIGKHYYAVTYCEVTGKCQIAVASFLEEEVSVNITLPSGDDRISVTLGSDTYKQGQTIRKTLNKFQAIQVQCECDLTGTKIMSPAKIAVFSGAMETVVGVKGSKSFHIEQMPPFKEYGEEYAYWCSSSREQGAFIRILATNPATQVEMTGYKNVIVGEKKFIHRRIESQRTVYIRASKPVLVVIFILNKGTDHTSSMHVLQPIDKSAKSYLMRFPTGIQNATVTFIGPVGTIYLKDRDSITDPLIKREPITGSVLSAAQYNIMDRDTTLEFSSKSGDPFIIYSAFTKTTSGSTGRVITHSISPVAVNGVKTQSPWPQAPIFDGDGVEEDSVDCRKDHAPETRSEKDCRKYSSRESDSEGLDFQLAFPIFNDNVNKLSLKVNGFDFTCRFRGNCDDRDPTICSDSSTQGDIIVESCFAVNDTGFFPGKAMNFHTYNSAIESNKEVTVRVTIEGEKVSASYLAYPTDTLGLEYYAITFCTDGLSCGCTVTTIYPNTTVYVKLHSSDTSVTFNGHQYTADKLIKQHFTDVRSVFMFTSYNDLTGTFIKGNAPISVLCGGRSNSSMFLEQMLPVEKTSDTYMVFEDKTKISYRIVASSSNTIVTATSSFIDRHILRQAGDYVDISIGSPNKITATRPVYAVAIVNGLIDGKQIGAMWNVVPESGTQTNYYFSKPDSYNSTEFIIVGGNAGHSVVLSDTATRTTKSTLLRGHVTLVKNPGYATTKINMSDESPFALYVMADAITSYPFFALQVGRKLPDYSQMCTIKPATTVSDNEDNDCDGLKDEDICVKDLFRLSGEELLTDGKYIPDFDVDGSHDEDCYTYCTLPTTTLESSSLETTTEWSSSLFESTPNMISTPLADSTLDSSTASYDLSTYDTLPASAAAYPTLSAEYPASSVALNLESSTIPTTTNDVTGINPTSASSFSAPTVSRAVCKCPCKRTPSPTLNNITIEELKEVMAKTKKQLTVEKSTLTMFKLKKVSANDNRPSAVTFGAFGAIFIVLVFGVILAGDLMSLQAFLNAAKEFGSAFSK